VLYSSLFEVEIPTAKLKNYKLPSMAKILAEMIQAYVKYYCLRSTKSLILFGIRKNCLISERVQLYQFTKRVLKLTNNYHGISLLSTSYKILLSRLSPYYVKLLRIISVYGVHVTDQLLIRLSAFVRYWWVGGRGKMRQYIRFSETYYSCIVVI
jgi:hypothetical protein